MSPYEHGHERFDSIGNQEFLVRSEFLTASTRFLDVTSCNLVQVQGFFGGTYCVRLQGGKVSEAARSVLEY
jgi:hypothetical protein